jgi:hypothetical protein
VIAPPRLVPAEALLSTLRKPSAGDLALDAAVSSGFPILRRIAKNTAEHGVDHQVVFGFSYQTARTLVGFLKRHRVDLRHVTGVRYSGELGHPFHVVEDDTVIVPLDHPFVKDGRFASLLVRDRELAESLATGFHELWRKAMRSLREIEVDPVRLFGDPRDGGRFLWYSGDWRVAGCPARLHISRCLRTTSRTLRLDGSTPTAASTPASMTVAPLTSTSNSP